MLPSVPAGILHEKGLLFAAVSDSRSSEHPAAFLPPPPPAWAGRSAAAHWLNIWMEKDGSLLKKKKNKCNYFTAKVSHNTNVCERFCGIPDSAATSYFWMQGGHESVIFIAGAHRESQLDERHKDTSKKCQAFPGPLAEQSQETDGHVWAPSKGPHQGSVRVPALMLQLLGRHAGKFALRASSLMTRTHPSIHPSI